MAPEKSTAKKVFLHHCAGYNTLPLPKLRALCYDLGLVISDDEATHTAMAMM